MRDEAVDASTDTGVVWMQEVRDMGLCREWQTWPQRACVDVEQIDSVCSL